MSLCWRAHCSSRWRSAHTPRPDPPRPYSDRPRFPCWGSCSSLADSTRERAFGRSGHAELPCPSAQIAFQTRTRSGTRAHSSTTLILKQHHHFAYDRASRKYDETVAAVQRQAVNLAYAEPCLTRGAALFFVRVLPAGRRNRSGDRAPAADRLIRLLRRRCSPRQLNA